MCLSIQLIEDNIIPLNHGQIYVAICVILYEQYIITFMITEPCHFIRKHIWYWIISSQHTTNNHDINNNNSEKSHKQETVAMMNRPEIFAPLSRLILT